LREVAETRLESGADLSTQVAARRLDDTSYLPKTLLEAHFSEAVAALVSELAVEVELDFVADEPASHREDLACLHLAFDLLKVADPVWLDRQRDGACLWQLHPQVLELLPVAVAGGSELQFLSHAAKETRL